MAEHSPKPHSQAEYLQANTLPTKQNDTNPELTDIQISPLTQFADIDQTMTVLIQDKEVCDRHKMRVFEMLVEDYGIFDGLTLNVRKTERPVSEQVTREYIVRLAFGNSPTFAEVRSAFEDIYSDMSEREAKLSEAIGSAFNRRANIVRDNIAFNRHDDSIKFPTTIYFPHDAGLYPTEADFNTGLLELLGSDPEHPNG